MGELIPILGGRIGDASVAAALVSGAIALAMVATRQPSRRRALARAGVIGTLLVVPLVVVRPIAPVDLLDPLRWALEGLAAGAPGWVVAALRWTGPILLVLYLAGVALGLGRLALGWLGAGWVGRNSEPASAGSEALYRDLPTPPGRARPALRVSARTTRPVLLGAFRPTILIPPDLDRPESAGALRLALLHELAHAEGADPWFGLATELAAVLWFWLPPVRWIGRQMRLDQEFLADRRAADRLGAASRYASTLVEIAASTPRPPGGAPASPGAGSALLQRVLMLIRSPFPVEARTPRWWRGTLGVATALLLLLATGLTLRARTHPAPAHPAPPRVLELPQVVLQPAPAGASAAILPVRLPSEFTVEFDVVAAADELPLIRILERPLAAGPTASGAGPHRVALRREGGGLSLGLDGGAMTPLAGPSAEEWLSARGLPGRPVLLKNLRLSR